jgi:hypothetical protein
VLFVADISAPQMIDASNFSKLLAVNLFSDYHKTKKTTIQMLKSI